MVAKPFGEAGDCWAGTSLYDTDRRCIINVRRRGGRSWPDMKGRGMQFRLTYNGQIQSRQQAGLPAVQAIREALSPQIERLWQYPPLNQSTDWLNPSGTYHACSTVDDWNFVSTISNTIGLYGELDILILRPQPLGSVVSKDGDLDNKLKTLIDALTLPTLQQVQDMKRKHGLEQRERQFCVFSDDNLITKLSVTSDRLLEDMRVATALVIINVTVRVGKPSIGNIHLA